MKEITAKELEEKLNNEDDVDVIDVREDEEVAQGKIPSARHIPLGELPDRLDEVDKDKTHYLVCRSGGRSGKACSFLIDNGYDVINLKGGMLDWTGDVKK